ncbi:hypothetical protein J7K28_01245 [Candidatus Aerophobetes bacterium]|nr:hypothetical protein [Candidatus Aerophobetes bacterium]
MNLRKNLENGLKRFSHRDTLIQMVNRVILYFGGAICFYLILWGINRFFPLFFLGKEFFTLISLVSTGLAIGITFLRRKTLFEVARFIDKKSKLKERISTAWEFSSKKKDIFVPFLLRDALSKLQEIKTSSVFPYYFPSQSKYLFYALIVIFLFLSLSHFPFLYMRKRRVYLYQQVNTLKSISRELLEQGKRENLKSVTLFVPRLEELSEKTERGEIGPEELLKAYEYLREEMKAKIEEKKRELLQKLNSLLQREKQESSFKDKLQEAIEAIKKEEYKRAGELLRESSLSREKKELKELESLSKAQEELERDSRYLSNRVKKEVKDQKENFRGIAEKDNQKEEFLSTEIKSFGGVSPYSPLSSKEKGKEGVPPEAKQEGSLSKVEGEKEDTLLMSLVEELFLPDSPLGLKEREAFSSYRRFMINKIFEEKIPADYKERVKEYFTSLEPK